MGCSAGALKVNNTERPAAHLDSSPLSAETKQIISKLWKLIEPYEALAGRKLFKRLLEENPHLQNTFPSFRGVELQDLLNSRSLYLHAERVMAAVRKVVTTLEESKLTISCLHDLGKRHILWGISRRHFDVVGETFLCTLKDLLGDKFTAEAEQAWGELFVFIADTMLQGIEMAKQDELLCPFVKT